MFLNLEFLTTYLYDQKHIFLNYQGTDQILKPELEILNLDLISNREKFTSDILSKTLIRTDLWIVSMLGQTLSAMTMPFLLEGRAITFFKVLSFQGNFSTSKTCCNLVSIQRGVHSDVDWSFWQPAGCRFRVCDPTRVRVRTNQSVGKY